MGSLWRRGIEGLLNFSGIGHQVLIIYYLLQMENQYVKYWLFIILGLILALLYILKYQIMKHKQYLLLVQTVILTFIISNDPEEAVYDDARIYFGSLVCMLSFGMSWMQYLSFTVILNISRCIIKGFPLYFLTYTQWFYLIASCTIFGFGERAFKEYWVLCDSHK